MLPQEAETHSVAEDEVVNFRPRLLEAVHAAGLQVDSLEECLCVLVELTCGGFVQDRGKLPLQFPRVEEELPVDVLAQKGEVGLDDPRAGELRHLQLVERDPFLVRARLRNRQQRLAVTFGVLRTQPFLQLRVLLLERHSPARVEEVGNDPDDTRGVEHVHGRL